MTQSQYRIVKRTYGDGTELFLIQYRRLDTAPWVLITTRETIEEAREVITTTSNNSVVKEEVVE